MVNNEGKYDHLLVKQADIQYRVMMTQIALANEKFEENRLRRIGLAMKYVKLTQQERIQVEAAIEEDVDFTDLG